MTLTEKKKEIKSLKYRISELDNRIIRLTRFDKDGSHRNAILDAMERKRILKKELKKIKI